MFPHVVVRYGCGPKTLKWLSIWLLIRRRFRCGCGLHGCGLRVSMNICIRLWMWHSALETFAAKTPLDSPTLRIHGIHGKSCFGLNEFSEFMVVNSRNSWNSRSGAVAMGASGAVSIYYIYIYIYSLHIFHLFPLGVSEFIPSTI